MQRKFIKEKKIKKGSEVVLKFHQYRRYLIISNNKNIPIAYLNLVKRLSLKFNIPVKHIRKFF